jgi:endogenous inhibitor of DNA gyrase (YacG/DUF329 family)
MKIEIRTDCKVCGGDLPNSRFRTYCSEKCRRKFFNKKYSHKAVARNRERRRLLAEIKKTI